LKTNRKDLGEIIRNNIYVREIYAICYQENEKCLFSSEYLFNKLTRIYDFLGVKQPINREIKVKIKLPSNPNPKLRDYWHETMIKKSHEDHLVTKIDRFFRYYKNEVVYASDTWMGDFETFPGDKVVISCCFPVMFNKNDFHSSVSLMEATN
jgi:hypothetical protein